MRYASEIPQVKVTAEIDVERIQYGDGGLKRSLELLDLLRDHNDLALRADIPLASSVPLQAARTCHIVMLAIFKSHVLA